MKQFQIIPLAVFFLFIGILAFPHHPSLNESTAETQIEGNVPVKEDFDKFLKRDLDRYLQDLLNKNVNVEYELLRNAPTQSGLSFPKFYAWVKVIENNILIEEGAVRLAAIGKKRFEVTHYLNRTNIEGDTQQLDNIFPRLVAEKIKDRIGK